MALYDEHGNFEVCWEGDRLLVQPCGAFNEEGALSFNKSIVDTVEARIYPDWYRFEVFCSRDTMGTPEAESHLVDSFAHSRLNGCKMVVIVGANVCARESLTKACLQAGIHSMCFDEMAEANAYVHALQVNN